jgi:2-iminoacetate synthase
MFDQLFYSVSWNDIEQKIQSVNERDIQCAIAHAGHGTPDDFLALISPLAAEHLPVLAEASRKLTRKRFGNTIQMYIPMYLSNECQNICTYCGFRYDNQLPRVRLSDEQIISEAEHIKAMGFDHVLLVTGEANKTVGIDYLEHAIKIIRPFFQNISIEVQPLDSEEYVRLIQAGVYSVLVYQETYHEANYKHYHPKGKKSNFTYRLQTPDRLGKSGIHKIGLGVLLGLENWRVDSYFTALHQHYLQKVYWKTKYSISFPRLRPAIGMESPKYELSNRDLVQLICAYRLFNEDLELSLSTREEATFRDHLFSIGVTSVSAGSKTNPGGYATLPEELEQFEIDDKRSPAEIVHVLKSKGLQPLWKDWEKVFSFSE